MSTSKLSQLPQLFRGPFLRKIGCGRYYQELSERLKASGLEALLDLQLREIFEYVYEVLLHSYRCEYVFKNAIALEWLQYRKPGQKEFITDEFRVGQNRVDLAVFGKSMVAFEIKSEYDSACRLASQTSEYTKVFDNVYVVTSPSLQSKLLSSIPKSVGIMQLWDSGKLVVTRDSQSHALQTNFGVAFDCLRQAEMIAIVEEVTNTRIDVPTSRIYAECRSKLKNLLPYEIHRLVGERLSKRSHSTAIESLLNVVPKSLKHAALSLRASKQEIESIQSELSSIPQSPPRIQPVKHEHILPIPSRTPERVACA